MKLTEYRVTRTKIEELYIPAKYIELICKEHRLDIDEFETIEDFLFYCEEENIIADSDFDLIEYSDKIIDWNE